MHHVPAAPAHRRERACVESHNQPRPTSFLPSFLPARLYLRVCLRLCGLQDAGGEGPTLPTKSDEEYRPFIRRLPEFKFWYTRARSEQGANEDAWEHGVLEHNANEGACWSTA